MGAGLMGRSLRGCGWAGGALTGTWAAGGPILLQVAASKARGEGWESCGQINKIHNKCKNLFSSPVNTLRKSAFEIC